MNKKILLLFKHRQEIQKRWKQGQATWKEYREVVRVSKKERRKAKALQELDLTKYDRDKMKGLFKHNDNKRKTKDNVGLLLNGGGAGSRTQ